MLRELIADRIRTSGPISFAEFMELSLYHPELGYYARAAQKTGRAGDFFTSVDVGPIFGELLAKQFAEMWRVLAKRGRAGLSRRPGNPPDPFFDLVEAGAGNGRLSRDILDAAQPQRPGVLFRHPALARRAVARRARGADGDPRPARAACFTHSGADSAGRRSRRHLRQRTARRAADARRRHDRERTARSVRRYLRRDGASWSGSSEPSTPRIAEYLARAGAEMRVGWRAEVNLRRRRLDDARGRLACARGFWSSSTTATTSASSTAPHTRPGTLTSFKTARAAGRFPAGARRDRHHGTRGSHGRDTRGRTVGPRRARRGSIRHTSCWAWASPSSRASRCSSGWR